MAVNRGKPDRWEADIAQSVDMYNDWFMKFAPKAFRETRIQTTKDVEATLQSTGNLTNIQPATIRKHPEILPTFRMSTCPPLAVDRLIGLASVPTNLVRSMELDKGLPPRMPVHVTDAELDKIAAIIEKMADPDILSGLAAKSRRPRPKSTAPQPSSRIDFAEPSQTQSSAMPRKSGSSPQSRRGSTPAATSTFHR